MEEMQIFENPEFGKIRTAGTSEKPLFCAADVCKALGYANGRDAVAKHVDEGDVAKCDTPTANQFGAIVQQQLSFVNESGLYALIFGSKLPKAKAFKHWVTSEVLPSIRKYGFYSNLPSYQISDPIKRAEKWIEEEKERQKLLEKVEEQKPKVEYFDKLVDRKLNTNFRDTAKEIGLKQNDFIKKLLDAKYIYRDAKGKIKPYAKYAEDMFIIKECAGGDKLAGMQTLITPKGRETFSLLFGEK